MPDTPIRVGQIYRSCDPRTDGNLIQVIDVPPDRPWGAGVIPGEDMVSVVPLDPAAGRAKQIRRVRRTELHATATTGLGVPRRLGYVLVPRDTDPT